MSNLNQCISSIFSNIGSHCIYKDKSSIWLVELMEVRISGNELELTLKPIPSEGFRDGGKRSFQIGGLLEVLGIESDRISASYGLWQLFTDGDLVKHLASFAAATSDLNALLREMRVTTSKSLRARK
jgi:hypothetical protein